MADLQTERDERIPRPPQPRRLPWRWITAAAAVLLAAAGLYFAPQMIRIVTNKGTIVIETDDGARIAVEIRDGQGTVLGTAIGKKREITVKAGECNIDVTVQDSGGEQRFLTDHFILTRNGKQTVDARREAAKFEPATAPASLATDPPTIPASADPDRRAAEWCCRSAAALVSRRTVRNGRCAGF